MINKFKKIVFTSLISLSPLIALATNNKMSYIPQLYITNSLGSEFSGGGDLLVPLYLNSNNIFAIYSQGDYSPKDDNDYATWSTSAGLLYRLLPANFNRIFGMYILTDYNQTNNGHKYWNLAPGFESLGNAFDFHMNGYFPVGKSSWSQEEYASKTGNLNYLEFKKGTNNIYDHKFLTYEEVGIGGDLSIGKKLIGFKNGTIIKGHIQGYGFDFKNHSNIFGSGIKLSAESNNDLKYSINYTYDNYQHNIVMLDVEFKFNSLFTAYKPVHHLNDRLLERLDRGYANIASGNTSLVVNSTRDLGASLLSTNGYFIDISSTSKQLNKDMTMVKGAYGNPFNKDDIINGDIQDIINQLKKQNGDNEIYLFLAPGTYNSYIEIKNDYSHNYLPLNLYDKVSIYGLNKDLTAPANENDRPLLIGSLYLYGHNTLHSIRIENLIRSSINKFNAGVYVNKAANIELTNIKIGTLSYPGSYPTAIEIYSDKIKKSDVIIKNSNIFAYTEGFTGLEEVINSTAINIVNGGTLNILDSEIKSIADNYIWWFLLPGFNAANNTGNAYGIHASGRLSGLSQLNLNIERSSIYASGKGGHNESGNAYAVLVGEPLYSYINPIKTDIHDNKINIIDSNLEAHASNKNGDVSGNAYGLLVGYGYTIVSNYNDLCSEIKNNKIDIKHSTLKSIGNGVGFYSGNGYGIVIGTPLIYTKKSSASYEDKFHNYSANNTVSIYGNSFDIQGNDNYWIFSDELAGKSYDIVTPENNSIYYGYDLFF